MTALSVNWMKGKGGWRKGEIAADEQSVADAQDLLVQKYGYVGEAVYQLIESRRLNAQEEFNQTRESLSLKQTELAAEQKRIQGLVDVGEAIEAEKRYLERLNEQLALFAYLMSAPTEFSGVEISKNVGQARKEVDALTQSVETSIESMKGNNAKRAQIKTWKEIAQAAKDSGKKYLKAETNYRASRKNMEF